MGGGMGGRGKGEGGGILAGVPATQWKMPRAIRGEKQDESDKQDVKQPGRKRGRWGCSRYRQDAQRF